MDARPVTIPETHIDLLTRPIVVTLVTLMPDGTPQATPTWADWDGEFVIVNTARGRQKDRNMRRRRRVTILAMDPDNAYRWLEVRGEVARDSEDDGVEWINCLAKKYHGKEQFYGGVAPVEQQHGETRVTYRIRPTRVNASRPRRADGSRG